MIDLTPLEVRKKKGDFRRGMRGYDPQGVDDFLDLVADRLEQLVRENSAMQERLSRVEDQVNDYRERERALTEALVTAQEMREEMRKQIEREVELKRREAEADADVIRAEAEQLREREEESIRRLRARQIQFVQSYRQFLERELSELSVMAEALDPNRTGKAGAAARRPHKQRPEPPEVPQREPERKAQPAPKATPGPKAPPPPVAMPAAEVTRDLDSEFEPYAGGPVQAVEDGPFIPDADQQQEADDTPKTIDDMLNELPPFAGAAEVKQVQAAARPKTTPEPAVNADQESNALAEVRAEFDELVAADLPPLAPEAAAETLDLVDDVAGDEDEDGWMSTLLEGKGDKGRK
jgi:cell division initiation protein